MREAAVVDGYGVSDPQLEYITRTLQTPAKLCRSPLSVLCSAGKLMG